MPKLFVPTPNTVEVTLEHRTTENITACHVLHFLNLFPPTTTGQTNAFVGEIAGWYRDNVVQWLSIEWQFDTCTILPIDTVGLSQTIDHAHIKKGGIVDKVLPNNCAVRLELLTLTPGRSYHGHKKVGGIPRSVVDGNRVKPTWLEFLRASWETLIGASLGFGWQWCVLSKTTGGVSRSAGVMTPIVAVGAKDDVVDSCRSRVSHTLD